MANRPNRGHVRLPSVCPLPTVADWAERVARLLADREVDAIDSPKIWVEGDDTGHKLGGLENHDRDTGVATCSETGHLRDDEQHHRRLGGATVAGNWNDAIDFGDCVWAQ